MRKLILAAFSVLGLVTVAQGAISSGYYPYGDRHWKAPVASVGALPTTGNLTGDTRIELTTYKAYVWNGSAWTLASGSGTVTSVGLALPSEFSVSGSPVTTSGTLTGAWANQSANRVFAGPASGGAATPAFRALVAADIPTIPLATGVSGVLPVANGGTGTGTQFTSGSVVFADGAGVYAQDNSNFFWDDTNNRLGLGTTNPTGQLALAGNRSASAWGTAGLALQVSPGGATYTDTSSSGTVAANYVSRFTAPTLAASSSTTYTNAATLSIGGAPAAGANVTIGSAFGLLVQGKARMADGLSTGGTQSISSWTTNGPLLDSFSSTLTDTSSAASATVTTRTANSFNTPTFASSNAITVTNGSTLYVASAPTAGTNTTITNPLALHVASGNSFFNGNVGVGLVSPGSRLVVKGTTTDSTSSALNVTNSSDGTLFYVRNDGLSGIGTSSPETKLHIFGTGTTTTLGQLDTNLRLQSNTSTVNAGSEISFRGSSAAATNVGTYAAISAPLSANSGTGSAGYLAFSTKSLFSDTSLSERMRIGANGFIGVGTNAPAALLHLSGNRSASAWSVGGGVKSYCLLSNPYRHFLFGWEHDRYTCRKLLWYPNSCLI